MTAWASSHLMHIWYSSWPFPLQFLLKMKRTPIFSSVVVTLATLQTFTSVRTTISYDLPDTRRTSFSPNLFKSSATSPQAHTEDLYTNTTLTSFQHLLYKVHLRFIFKKQRDKSKQIWQRFSSWQVSFLFMCCLGSRAIGKQQQQSWHYVDLLQYRARRVSGSHSKLIAELAADNKCNCAYENQSYGIVNMYLTSFQTSP